jgi:hypothetical protein
LGGVTAIRSPIAILNALLQPDHWVARHSSTERQYSVLYNMGIVRFDDATRKAIQLIDTSDNRRAVELAKDLLRHGEAMQVKERQVGDSANAKPGTPASRRNVSVSTANAPISIEAGRSVGISVADLAAFYTLQTVNHRMRSLWRMTGRGLVRRAT